VANAKKIATPGKGILAADESTGTIGKRFASINLENNEENRRLLREILLTSPGALQYLSGVIFFEEQVSTHWPQPLPLWILCCPPEPL
jgi:fructose-bisphosphate aldolase class I